MRRLKTLRVLIAIFGLCALPVSFAETLSVASLENTVLATQIIYGTAPVIVDVRTPEEFSEGHVPGALNIPFGEIANRRDELGIEPDGMLVVYCRSGKRAGIAQQALAELGYTGLVDLDGHWLDWSAKALPVQP